MRNVTISFVLILASSVQPPLCAQELEEIIVTAQRREQNLQEVPVSITVFTGTEIDQANIKSAVDYLALTPNVSFTEDGQSGSRGLGISVRGVNNLVSGENAVVNSVGIYLDEFSVASVPNQVANPFIPDMERIEVLRGPQGTYFGRNALGGAINLTTKRPTDVFEGSIQIGGETYENAGQQFNSTGILNIPVSDDFKLRGVLYYEDSSGRVKNICAAGERADKCPVAFANNFLPNGTRDSGHQYFMGRLKTLWDLSDSTSAELTLIYADENQGHDANVPTGILDLDTVNTFLVEDAADPGTGFWPDNRNRLSHDRAETNELESLLAILNIQHRFDQAMVLKWISGVLNAEQVRLFDNDLVGGADIVVRDNLYEGLTWSSELRIEANHDALDWTVGALYAEDEQTQKNDVFVGVGPAADHDLDPPNGIFVLPGFPEGLGLLRDRKRFDVRSIAVFGDLTLHVGERLELIAGGRYTRDEVETDLRASGIRPSCCFPFTPEYPGPPGPEFFASFINVENPPANGSRTFNDFSPRFGLRYKFSDDVSAYGLVSKGYKAGGTSLGNSPEIGAPAFSRQFEDETLWNYELGLKSEWFDHRVRLNGAVFYMDWNDMQFESFQTLRPGPLAPVIEQTINIDSANALGGEIELLMVPTDRITISAALGYQDTEINSPEMIEITGGFLVDLQGLDVPKAPELTASATGEYRGRVGRGEGWLQIEVIHRDGQYSDIEALTNRQTLGPAPVTGLSRAVGPGEFPYRTPNYSLVNLRAGYESPPWSLAAYIQNVTDEKYYTGTQENFGISGIRVRPHPRVFGLTASFSFSSVD